MGTIIESQLVKNHTMLPGGAQTEFRNELRFLLFGKIADGIEIPRIKPHREYEVDEMWTFLGNKYKPLWIGYALDRKSKEVVAFNVGGRSIEMLSTIFKTVNRSAPAKVYTDYLVHYLSLVPCEVHVRGKRGTTHIERHNLNLRTHLK